MAHKALGFFLILLSSPLYIPLGAEKAGSDDKARRPLLGVVHSQARRGVRIEKILPDSAAARGGLQVGDIILSVNGVAIENPRHLFTEIQRYAAGAVVAIEYQRNGSEAMVQVALGERLDISALVGKEAPAITAPALDAKLPFAGFAGKVTVIDFWATWCGPCEPVRRALEDFGRDQRNSAMQIVGITAEDAAAVRSFFRGKRLAYPILLDTKGYLGLAYRVAGYPTVVVVDQKGMVRFAGFASGGGLEQALEMAAQLAKKHK